MIAYVENSARPETWARDSGSPGWSRKKGRKTVCVCVIHFNWKTKRQYFARSTQSNSNLKTYKLEDSITVLGKAFQTSLIQFKKKYL